MTTQPQRVQLRDFIVECFSREDLITFCSDYFRDFYEDYEGSSISKSALVRNLVDYCEQHGLIGVLKVNLQQVREKPYLAQFERVSVVEVRTQPRNPKQVFLSHAHEDADLAKRLAQDLREAGLSVWMTPDSVQPGEQWASAIERGLDESKIFLVLLTPNSVKSRWVKKETLHALENEDVFTITPVLAKLCDVNQLSRFLNQIQHINLERDYAQGLDTLCIRLGVQSAAMLAKARAEEAQRLLDGVKREREKLAAEQDKLRLEAEETERLRTENERLKQAAREREQLQRENEKLKSESPQRSQGKPAPVANTASATTFPSRFIALGVLFVGIVAVIWFIALPLIAQWGSKSASPSTPTIEPTNAKHLSISAANVTTTVSPSPQTTEPTKAESVPVATGNGSTLRFYSSLPLTGSGAPQSRSIVDAIKLAIEQNTDGGKICDGKFTIDYVSLDDATAAAGEWDAAQEQANANKAVGDPEAVVYIGTFNSGAAKVSIPILNQATPPLAMVSPANTNVGLTKSFEPGEPDKYYPTGKRNFMRVVTAADVQGAIAAKWMQSLGIKKVYVLNESELYGKSLADMFDKTAKEIGLEIAGHDTLDDKTADYTVLAAKIKATDADGIYFGGGIWNNVRQLLKDVRSAGIDAKFMGAEGIFSNDFASTDEANGVLATLAGTPKDKLSDKGKKFYIDYNAKYGSEPEAYALYGYESANVAIATAKKVCAADRQKFLDTAMATKDFDGVLGTWSFDANGDTSYNYMIANEVKNGAWAEIGGLDFK